MASAKKPKILTSLPAHSQPSNLGPGRMYTRIITPTYPLPHLFGFTETSNRSFCGCHQGVHSVRNRQEFRECRENVRNFSTILALPGKCQEF